MKKLLLIFLSLLMIVSVFAACGDSKNATTPKPTTPKKDDPGTTQETPENEKLNVDLDSIDYDGAIVRVIHWQPDNAEFGMAQEEINGDAVNDAIYKRNLYTESELGITLEFNQEAYGYNKVNQFTDALKRWTEDPTTPVDIIAAQTRMMPTILVQGYLADLNLFSALDFDKAWWPESCRELHEIKGNLYFATGDVSPNLLRQMTLLFVNKTMLEARGHNYEEFMQTIENGNWTLDLLMEMTSGVWMNGDDATQPGPSVDDEFGLVTAWMHSDALYAGCGFTYMKSSSSDDQVFRLSPDMLSETVANYVSRMLDYAKTYDFYCGNVGSGLYQTNFKEGRSLFMLHRAWYGFTLQSTEIKYAIIPTPKFNEDQDEYFTTIGNQVTSYGVANDSDDLDRAAETLQVLGYYGFNNTTPAIFEISFKGKHSKDDYTIKMFDIVRDAITFDPGRIYDSFLAGPDGEQWQYYPPNVVSFTLSGGREGWTTDKVWTTEFSAAKQKLIRGLIDEANAKLLEYINAQ